MANAKIVKDLRKDWSLEGFKNPTFGELGISPSPEPKISYTFCANAEIQPLCTQLIDGGRESAKYKKLYLGI